MKFEQFVKRSPIDAPAEEVFNWHAREGAIKRLSPPWSPLKIISKTPGVSKGTRVNLKIKTGPVFSNWHAEHTACSDGKMFRDSQVKGPFRQWHHTHSFIPTETGSILEDRIEFALPAIVSSIPLANNYIKKDLERIFTYRHLTTQRDFQLHLSGKINKPLKIAITGASGLIGSSLTPFLTTGGHDVYTLVRRPVVQGKNEIFWDPASGKINAEELEGFDAVIHLAGENIGEVRWTDAVKARLTESRTKGTALIAETLTRLKNPPKVFLCASAIGYYGETGDNIVDENNGPGTQFISGLCKKWEASSIKVEESGIRTVHMRIGVVLSPEGGALSKLIFPFKAGLGARLGSGNQYMSWVSLPDIIGGIFHLLADESIHGPVNLVSPNPVINSEFTQLLGKVLKRPAFFKIPEFIIKAAFGEMGEELLLSGNRVQPTRLMESGYTFYHSHMKSALSEVLGAM